MSVTCFKGRSILLIKRGKHPLKGIWVPPGGRVAWGEKLAAAAARELREQAGVTGEIVGVVDAVDQIIKSHIQAHFVITCFAARWIEGEPITADDAHEARWFTPEELATTRLTHTVRRIIRAASNQAFV